MSGTDDGIWGVLFVCALVGGGWWLLSKDDDAEDEIRPPTFTPTPIPIRPTEPYTVIETKEGASYVLDPSTVVGPRSSRRAWISIDYSNVTSVSHRTTRELVWTNCNTGEVKSLSNINYNADGKVGLAYGDEFDEAETKYFPPDTVGAATPAEMCKSTYDTPK